MKYKRVILVSYFFSRTIGGAEKSIKEEILKYKKEGKKILVITFDKKLPEGKIKSKNIETINFHLKNNSKTFSIFTRTLINKKFVFKILEHFLRKDDLILTQTPLSVSVGEYCINKKIPYIVYLRDEQDINKYKYYENKFTLKYIFYFIRKILNLFLMNAYIKKRIIILKKSKQIISNSKYTQKKLFEKYNLKSIVKYPKIDFFKLDKSQIKKENQNFIGFIGGGNNAKGWKIIKKIAKKMPKEKFLIVGDYKKKFKIENLYFMPKQKDIMNFYKKINLLLVPSIWEEAFGRVVKEANYLGIPVLTSNKGGLPEANINKDNIIKDVEDIDLWIKKIKLILKN